MNDDSHIDIKKYLQVIIKRKYLFIAVSLCCLSVIVWGSFFMPKIYQAKSTVFIENNVVKRLVKGIAETPSMEDRLRVITYAMMSRNMLLKVVKVMDLDTKAKNEKEVETIIADFQKNTNINVKGEDLFIVTYKGKNPKTVRDYVNTLIGQYIEENTSSKREEVLGANKFLSEQIEFYKKKIDESEQRLIDFRREKGIYLSSDEGSLITSIKNGKNEIEEIISRVREVEARRDKTKQQLSGETPLTLAVVDSESGGGDSALSARLKALEQKIPMLLTRYTENYPEVIKTRGEIETIKKQIEEQKQNPSDQAGASGLDQGSGTSMMNPVYQQLKEDLFRADSEIDSLKAKSAAISSRIGRMESELRDIPQEKKQLSELERDRNSYQKIYEQLLSRLGQSEISEQMEIQDKGTNFRIVDAAIMPTRPVSPDRVMLILFGIAAGIAAGTGAVLLREYFDHSIKDIDTLKAELKRPVLAVIPLIVTEYHTERQKKFDKKIYTASIAYLSIICGLFIKELIGKFL